MSLPEYFEDLYFEGNQGSNPRFRCDVFNEELTIEGHLIALQRHSFYNPVWHWLNKFLMKSQRKIEVYIKLPNLNITEPNIWYLLNKLNQYNTHRGNVRIFWYYPKNSLESYETGKEYCNDFDIPFDFIAI